MKTRFRLIGIVGLCFAALVFARATGIDGRWAADIDTQVGVQKYVYEFKTGADGTLTGKAQWDRMGQTGETQLKDVKLAGDAVSFVETISIPDMNMELPVTYTGKLVDDELKLTRTVGEFATEPLVAKRVTGAAPASPAAAATPAAPAAAAVALTVPPPAVSTRAIAPGPFQPTWESLAAGYRVPDWFRDAKFGIWAHWSAQCVPEQGDWYARNMYLQGTKNYDYHVAHYGHPSKFGFMELDNLWKAEKWEPEKLMALYKKAGAKYFVALANHHDNFDAYDSKYQPWNSVNIGPKKDIVGTWAKIARENGLRFGVSNHSSHAWHWFQPAYGHDVEGPLAGVPYDAATLTKADGKGKWWEGLDPQDLYCGLRIPMPNNLPTAKVAEDWHRKIDGNWYEIVPPNDNGYAEKWFLRCQDLVDKYQPDLLYFDDTELPFGQIGLDIAAHLYNASAARNGGKTQAVLNSKGLRPDHRPAMVPDIERGVAEGIRPEPWQTDTCIGSWHYDRSIFEQHKYKTVAQVVRMLADIVSKNGNLLLSIPVRGDGSIDADEVAFLGGMAKWMDVNSEAIFGTRPWVVYGEGPSVTEKAEGGQFGGARDVRNKPYTSEDLRFTTKGGALYAVVLEWPAGRSVLVKSLATASPHSAGRKVSAVTLLGSAGKLTWSQDEAGLRVQLPAEAPSEHAVTLKIEGIAAR
jgi:alpha-L-fucosidase